MSNLISAETYINGGCTYEEFHRQFINGDTADQVWAWAKEWDKAQRLDENWEDSINAHCIRIGRAGLTMNNEALEAMQNATLSFRQEIATWLAVRKACQALGYVGSPFGIDKAEAIGFKAEFHLLTEEDVRLGRCMQQDFYLQFADHKTYIYLVDCMFSNESPSVIHMRKIFRQAPYNEQLYKMVANVEVDEACIRARIANAVYTKIEMSERLEVGYLVWTKGTKTWARL